MAHDAWPLSWLINVLVEVIWMYAFNSVDLSLWTLNCGKAVADTMHLSRTCFIYVRRRLRSPLFITSGKRLDERNLACH